MTTSDRLGLPSPHDISKGTASPISPVQDIPEANARIQAILNREHQHPFEVLDNIYRLQREKTKKDLEHYDHFYQRSPQIYDPTDEDTFILAMSYEDGKKKLNKDLAERVNARKPPSGNFGGKGVGIFDTLKRNFDNMNLEKLCRDSKAFYLYKRAGAYQTPGVRGQKQNPRTLQKMLDDKKIKEAVQIQRLKQLKRSQGSSYQAVDKAAPSTFAILDKHKKQSMSIPPSKKQSYKNNFTSGSSGLTSKESFFHTTRPKMVANLSKVSNLSVNQGEARHHPSGSLILPPLNFGISHDNSGVLANADSYEQFLEAGIMEKPKINPSFGFGTADKQKSALNQSSESTFQIPTKKKKSDFRMPALQTSPSPAIITRRKLSPNIPSNLSNYQKMRQEVISNLLNKKALSRDHSPESRINPQFTYPVPSVRGDEIKERIRESVKREQERLKKYETAQKPVKPSIFQSYESEASSSKHKKTKSNIDQKQEDARRAQAIIKLCNDVTPVKRVGNKDIDFQIFREQVSAANLNNILDFLMPLESADPLTLKRFYENKKDIDNEFKQSVDQVNLDYRLGMMDPSRDAAKVERLNRIKKNLGKKKLMNEVYEKAAPK